MTSTDEFADLDRAVFSLFKLPSSRPARRQPRWATEMRQLPDGRPD
jgi:hypothetical protein